MNAFNSVMSITPMPVRNWVRKRFNQDEIILANGAAFDMVRASVNLVLAGLLIAVGTSLKLPLSTTYVAFMVAMGSSLADRAWGRESAVFRITGVGMVAGCYVLDGKMRRNAQMRLLRDNIVIYDGAIASLQRFKDSVKEVAAGYECGITFEKFQDIKEGDIIEAFIMEEIER